MFFLSRKARQARRKYRYVRASIDLSCTQIPQIIVCEGKIYREHLVYSVDLQDSGWERYHTIIAQNTDKVASIGNLASVVPEGTKFVEQAERALELMLRGEIVLKAELDALTKEDIPDTLYDIAYAYNTLRWGMQTLGMGVYLSGQMSIPLTAAELDKGAKEGGAIYGGTVLILEAMQRHFASRNTDWDEIQEYLLAQGDIPSYLNPLT